MVTLEDLALHIGAALILKDNKAAKPVSGLATLVLATSENISFLSNAKYAHELATTKAHAVIVSPEYVGDCPAHALVMDDPYVGFAKAAHYFDDTPKAVPGIHPTAVVSKKSILGKDASIGAHAVVGDDVTLGNDVCIGPGCVIEPGVSVGAHTVLRANVTLYHKVKIGAHCILHAGVVVGSDGFGMANDKGRWIKISQLGSVVISDYVEVGANSTIDRGALGNTEIHEGAKLDNQMQIGHNVVIGAHTAMAANTAVAGSTTIGKHCLIGGCSAITGHIHIGDGVMLTGSSNVTHSLKKPGVYGSAIPARERSVWQRNVARFNQLDKLAKTVLALQKNVNRKL